MDDDYKDDSGFGSLAWYQMGRWSAQQTQRTRDWVNAVNNSVVAKADYDEAVRRAWSLANENRRLIDLASSLENQLAEYRHNYDRLSQWGDEVAKELNERRARDAERGQ